MVARLGRDRPDVVRAWESARQVRPLRGDGHGRKPGTRAWEREQLYFPDSLWAGHCNGFAAAALLEPEPTEPVTIFDITFSVADQKGLLVDYHFGDAAAWSFGEDGQLDPAAFHRMLLNWVQGAGKGFVLTYDMGDGEFWSYPLYRFESQWSVDPVDPELWHVKTTVWMADMDVPPNFVGTKPYPSTGRQDVRVHAAGRSA